MEEKPRICFYGLYCYPLFNTDHKYQVGGWETRMSLIARELAKRGNFDVTIIVAEYGQPHVEYRDGVRLVSWIGKRGGSPAQSESTDDSSNTNSRRKRPGLKSKLKDQHSSLSILIKERLSRETISSTRRAVLLPFAQSVLDIGYTFALTNLKALRILFIALKAIVKSFIQAARKFLASSKQAMFLSRNIVAALDHEGAHVILRSDVDILEEVNADIYIVLGNQHMSAVVANYCLSNKKKYVFFAGSEYDYFPEYKLDPNGRDMYTESYFEKTYAIEKAAFHVVQTRKQARMLEQGYGRSDSIVIGNPINLNANYPRADKPEGVLWVGKADERIKRPSLVLELARRLPNQSFVLIINKAIPETYSRCAAEAASLPNVTLIESVPFEEVEKYFASARMLVSTSVFEGFPNTFLQAAKYGVPIVATDVDPGEMLSRHGCGITCGGDFDLFVNSVCSLLNDDALYARMSSSILQYVREHHDKDAVITQYENVIRKIYSS
ncbi:MAG: glycosyltransferase family 4 protein [Chloroflexi bacterium]|nr:glycosyltransferase family 4 protein [Chloroflexota bacterium]